MYKIIDENALCIAAHPFNHVPLLQKIFFKRGRWENKDISHQKLSGLQILNGIYDKDFFNGMEIWKNQLLNGLIKYIYAGNDAHGNFNIYRQINTPLLTLKESYIQIFGNCRTGVLGSKFGDIPSVINSLKKGNCFITNSAYLNITFHHNQKEYSMGSIIQKGSGKLTVDIVSSKEFGMIKKLIVLMGRIGDKKEINIFQYENLRVYELKEIITINAEKESYFRCEVYLCNDNCFAYSNPIWLCP